MASMAATLGPIPLGLGTFEATCAGMLSLLGVVIETALAATLLLRGLTFGCLWCEVRGLPDLRSLRYDHLAALVSSGYWGPGARDSAETLAVARTIYR